MAERNIYRYKAFPDNKAKWRQGPLAQAEPGYAGDASRMTAGAQKNKAARVNEAAQTAVPHAKS